MRIACPACETAYDVPDSVVTAGRVLRCARCRGEWTPEPLAQFEPAEPPGRLDPAPELIVAAPPEEDPLPFIRPPSPPPPRAKRSVLAAWAASLAVLAVFIWSVIAWREPIMRHWPPAARLYHTLGYRKV